MAALSPAQAPVARGPLRCIGAPESSNPRQTMVVGSLIAARLGAAAHVAPAALHAALDGSRAPLQRGRVQREGVPGGPRRRYVGAATTAWPRDAIRDVPRRGRA